MTGTLADQDGPAAERLDLQAEAGEDVAASEDLVGLDGGQLDRLGDEQALGFDPAALDAALQLLVQDPLVQGVLVDDDHAVVGLGDQVAVVDLDRLRERRRSGSGGVAGTGVGVVSDGAGGGAAASVAGVAVGSGAVEAEPGEAANSSKGNGAGVGGRRWAQSGSTGPPA